MSDTAIRVEGLSKAYQIRHTQARSNYRTLREDLAALAQKPLRRAGAAPARETFWALDDVSFEVKHGEALGIIGRNGAGKSTLLKILSRITKPTKGQATVYGRVGSLLEVGTGFHPELTGRENIFLNGAILGMTKRDIQRHFDEIVDFAEVEQFLDTPVKRYSSGMYMRLAFAVAAHLEPEVLVVDEVLAVGDAAFQKKCLGKMGEVASGGRTVLFVSHNMGAVQQLCGRAILLNKGEIVTAGAVSEVISRYVESVEVMSGCVDLREWPNRRGGGPARFSRACTLNDASAVSSEFLMGEDLWIQMTAASHDPLSLVAVSVDIKTTTGIPVLHIVGNDVGYYLRELFDEQTFRLRIPNLSLYPGAYVLSLWMGTANGYDYDYAVDCLEIMVGHGTLVPRYGLNWSQAIFYTPVSWSTVQQSGAP